jgi:hypothetical protein
MCISSSYQEKEILKPLPDEPSDENAEPASVAPEKDTASTTPQEDTNEELPDEPDTTAEDDTETTAKKATPV